MPACNPLNGAACAGEQGFRLLLRAQSWQSSHSHRANPFSRTPSAFAAFQATTRGTASQAIKALEASGYLVRQRSKADGRSVSLRLTNKGNKALARDPFEALVRAVDSLDLKERTAMRQALHQLLSTVAASGAHRRFGVCQDCTYFGGERCCNPTIASPSLLGVPIQPEDAGLLCVHFQPTSEHNDGAHGLTSAICRKDA